MVRMPRSGLLAGSAALAAMATATAAHATTIIYVDQSAPGVGNGQSWDTAFSNLQTALSTINSQSTTIPFEIRIAHGVYTPTALSVNGAGFTISPGTLASSATLTIRGGYRGHGSPTPDARDFVSAATILSGDVLHNDTPDQATRSDNARSVVFVTGGGLGSPLTLDGLTIRDGSGGINGRGGGVYVLNSAPYAAIILNHCTIRSNRATYGGGLAVYQASNTNPNGPISVLNSTLTDNTATESGGAVHINGLYHVGPDFPLQLAGCTVENNRSEFSGGGLSVSYRSLVVENSTLRGNSAYYIGGGIAASSSHLTALNSLIADNSVDQNYGGGAYVDSISALNCTFAGNTASNGGGVRASNIEATNCVFAFNTGRNGARDLHVSATLTLTHSVATLEYSSPGHLVGGGTLSPESSGAFDFDPQFIDPDGPDNNPATWADNNYHLSPRSRAIDAGILDNALSILDAGGSPRLISGVIGRPAMLDLGCYESQLTLCPADLDADQAVTVDDLLDFLRSFEMGDALADLTTNGSTPFPDGAVTVEDLLFFLAKFEQGC